MLIGIDWGGTKIEAIALDADGTTLARERVPTPQHDYEGCVEAATGLVRRFEARLGRTGTVGMGIPGSMSPATGLVRNGNSTWINGRPLDRDMERALGRPVRIENDANCFAVSEATDGAGAGHRVVWALILGTGVGSGIAIEGRALRGANAIAGEWGHNPLPWPRDEERPGPDCFCGRSGCIEQFVSGPALARHHRDRTGETLLAEEIIAAMRRSNPAAQQTYRLFLDRLARAIAHVVNVLDPDVIVLGGGLSHVDELYPDLRLAVGGHVFSDLFATPIVRNVHGASSGVRGAAWLWREERSAAKLGDS